jgi:hypothetical protein
VVLHLLGEGYGYRVCPDKPDSVENKNFKLYQIVFDTVGQALQKDVPEVEQYIASNCYNSFAFARFSYP